MSYGHKSVIRFRFHEFVSASLFFLVAFVFRNAKAYVKTYAMACPGLPWHVLLLPVCLQAAGPASTKTLGLDPCALDVYFLFFIGLGIGVVAGGLAEPADDLGAPPAAAETLEGAFALLRSVTS